MLLFILFPILYNFLILTSKPFIPIDWDMIVVVNEYVGPLVKTATHPGATLPGFEEATVLTETMDITVYHEDYFRELLYENVIRILYVTSIPKSMVQVEKEAWKWDVSYQRMKLALYNYIKVRERSAADCWRKNQIWPAKKHLLHALRAMHVATQIVKTGKIENLTAPNFLWPLCASITFETFDDLFKWFKERYDLLYAPLKEQLNIYKSVFDDLKEPINKLRFLDYLQVHCHNDLSILERETGITATKIELIGNRNGNEIHENGTFLFERALESPKHPAVQLAYRVVACFNGQHWDVLAMAPKKYFEHGADRYVTADYEKFVETIEWPTLHVFRKPIGIGVLLFWAENEWKIVCANSGFYTSQYLLRYHLKKKELTDHLRDKFWSLWEGKQMVKPLEKFSKFAFQFTFHPEEEMLVLDGICDVEACKDVTMNEARELIAGEDSEARFLFFVSKLHSWDTIELLEFTLPSKTGRTDNAITKNYVKLLQHASEAAKTDFFKYEGFLLIDGSNARVQISHPAYHSLQMASSRYERKKRTDHFLKIVQSSITLPRGEERFCEYYPHWASWYRYLASVLRRMCHDMDEAYKPFKDISDPVVFRDAVNSSGYSQSKVYWKLRSLAPGKGALDYFTDLHNVNEGPAPQVLTAWINQMKVFEDLTSLNADCD